MSCGSLRNCYEADNRHEAGITVNPRKSKDDEEPSAQEDGQAPAAAVVVN